MSYQPNYAASAHRNRCGIRWVRYGMIVRLKRAELPGEAWYIYRAGQSQAELVEFERSEVAEIPGDIAYFDAAMTSDGWVLRRMIAAPVP